jgi:hypothetical protein
MPVIVDPRSGPLAPGHVTDRGAINADLTNDDPRLPRLQLRRVLATTSNCSESISRHRPVAPPGATRRSNRDLSPSSSAHKAAFAGRLPPVCWHPPQNRVGGTKPKNKTGPRAFATGPVLWMSRGMFEEICHTSWQVWQRPTLPQPLMQYHRR